MAIAEMNKSSYFYLELEIQKMTLLTEKALEKILEMDLDIVLAKMTASSNVYKFESEKKLIYLFSTERRKRKGQLIKLVDQLIKEKNLIKRYEIDTLLKTEFIKCVEELKKKESLKLSSEPLKFEGYRGEDLKVFKNKENWYKWQKDLYDKIFYKTGGVREADPRQIITIYDKEGYSGKSSFFKYLYFKYPNEIGRITYGTSSQLRSSLTNMGIKKIYIIDLTRSKSTYDKPDDLISAIEDLKNGLVCNAMYGSGNTMLMNPPHIIISANYVFDPGSLSKDRWKIFSIENKKLKDITTKVMLQEFGKALKTK